MRKKYNTPHRRHVVKTRLSDEEYADFTERLAAYEISQSEFIRQAITGAAIRPIITVSPVNGFTVWRRSWATTSKPPSGSLPKGGETRNN